MDFARKQLEKYGWTDGKGLGKHENGISEALKPKIKRSAAGIGHDPASEFNEHWWTVLYNKAASNVEIKEKNGKTKKIKAKEDFEITNSTWKLKHKSKDNENEEQYSDFFVRTAVLTKGGSKVEKVKESVSESEEEEKKDVFQMTDEELFKACEGRTAHKGARHGLKSTGKLARIAQQEAELLTEARFMGYSHVKRLKDRVNDEINFNSDSEETKHKKNKYKRKRKRCTSVDGSDNVFSVHKSVVEEPLQESDDLIKKYDDSLLEQPKKHKKSKKKHSGQTQIILEEDQSRTPEKQKKHKNEKVAEENLEAKTSDTIENVCGFVTKEKKKKKKVVD